MRGLQTSSSRSELAGAPAAQRSSVVAHPRSMVKQAATALFGRGKTAVAEPPAAPKSERRGLFGGGTKEAVRQQQTIRGGGSSKQVDKASEYNKKRSIFSIMDAAEARSKSDAELLYEAKYGARGSDGKMSREQYQALRRKIGGTAKDFWKTSIDVEGDYVDKGWVDRDTPSGVSASVPGLPFLVATAVGLVAAAVVIAERT